MLRAARGGGDGFSALLAALSLVLLPSLVGAEVVVQLPGDGADFVVDRPRDLIYVSVPAENLVVRVSVYAPLGN